MVGTSAGTAKRKRCKCGAFAHLGPCPSHLGMKLREGIKRNRPARDLMQRLWEKIAIGDLNECWEWVGGTNTAGYGHLGTPDGKRHLSHRLVVAAQPGEVVMHSCDNPPCCNPLHLERSTHAANMADMVSKGRQQKGESHWNSKLSYEQIEAIRGDLRSSTIIGQEYGLSSGAIRKIRRGARWSN